MTTYCGNNKFELQTGTKVLGTPYQCLRKGVGAGLHAPTPASTQYEPIDPPAPTYCGNSGPPPEGKVMGTRGACFRKGFGVGLRLNSERSVSGAGAETFESYDGSDISEASMVPMLKPSRAPLAEPEEDGYNFLCIKGPITARKVFLWVCVLAVMFIVLSFLLFSVKVVLKISVTLMLLVAVGYLISKLLGYL